jgi:hypothetical protein
MTPGKDINGMGIGLDESEFDFCNFVSLYFFFFWCGRFLKGGYDI